MDVVIGIQLAAFFFYTLSIYIAHTCIVAWFSSPCKLAEKSWQRRRMLLGLILDWAVFKVEKPEKYGTFNGRKEGRKGKEMKKEWGIYKIYLHITGLNRRETASQIDQGCLERWQVDALPLTSWSFLMNVNNPIAFFSFSCQCLDTPPGTNQTYMTRLSASVIKLQVSSS